MPENLAREVHEETGLRVSVGPPALLNEFHDPKSGFHQVEMFFRCTLISGMVSDQWQDPEGVVTKRQFFSRAALEARQVRFKPDSLIAATWGTGCRYDPLEVIIR